MPDLRLQFQHHDQDTAAAAPILAESDALDMLCTAEFVAERLVPWGTNYTFAVGLTDREGIDHFGIYKPQAGERPLWDFPRGTLYRREYASYLLSRWLGWSIVPPTVVREGPHGIGSLQLYIEPDPKVEDDHRFWGRRVPEVERIVMFDFIANNADRKIGHCLLDRAGRIWGIDHGLTFNVEPKVRTVLWQYCGEPISGPIESDLKRLVEHGGPLLAELGEVLDRREVREILHRAEHLLAAGRYPILDPHRNVPYGWW